MFTRWLRTLTTCGIRGLRLPRPVDSPASPAESPRLISRVASQLAGSGHRSVALGVIAAALRYRGLPHGVEQQVEELNINPWVQVATVERAVWVLGLDTTRRRQLLEHVSRVE